MPSSSPPGSPKARTVHVEDDAWERVQLVALRSRPKRSASDIVREMIDNQLSQFEADMAAGRNGKDKQ